MSINSKFIDWEEFEKDCESICFDCGTINDLVVFSKGVALCSKCYRVCVTCGKKIWPEDFTEYNQCLDCDYNNPIGGE